MEVNRGRGISCKATAVSAIVGEGRLLVNVRGLSVEQGESGRGFLGGVDWLGGGAVGLFWPLAATPVPCRVTLLPRPARYPRDTHACYYCAGARVHALDWENMKRAVIIAGVCL